MTLNILLSSRYGTFMSSDFRVTAGKQFIDDPPTQKQVLVVKRDWMALVSFAGVAWNSQVVVEEWLAQETARIPPNASFEALLQTLCKAAAWVPNMGNKADRWMTFCVGANAGGRMVIAVVSNYQYLDGRADEREPLTRLDVTTSAPQEPAIFCGGQGYAVDRQDRRNLTRLLSKARSPHGIHHELARANQRASQRCRGISPACFTAHILPDGTAEAMPHGIDETKEYLPKFIRHYYPGVELEPELDEAGKPRPRRLTGMVAVIAPGARAWGWMCSFRNVREPVRVGPEQAQTR